MPFWPRSSASQPSENAAPGELSPQQRLRRRADHVEELLAEARDRGEFDALAGKGKPLQLDENVFAGDKALAYRLLKQNHLAPPEIERGKEIDADLARAEQMVASLRRRRDALRMKWHPAFTSERRAYNLVRAKTEARYDALLREVRSKILSLNIVAPAPLHRRPLDVEARLREFRAEFPPLEE